MKTDMKAYEGDSGLKGKTIVTTLGDAKSCMSKCDSNPLCTHFDMIGTYCTLYKGSEWLGASPGSVSYCKSQCQGTGTPVAR